MMRLLTVAALVCAGALAALCLLRAALRAEEYELWPED